MPGVPHPEQVPFQTVITLPPVTNHFGKPAGNRLLHPQAGAAIGLTLRTTKPPHPSCARLAEWHTEQPSECPAPKAGKAERGSRHAFSSAALSGWPGRHPAQRFPLCEKDHWEGPTEGGV